MARSLETRVKQLEGGAGGECPECGFDGDWSKIEFDLEWCDDPKEDDGPQESVYCETCGEPTTIVVTWGDEA